MAGDEKQENWGENTSAREKVHVPKKWSCVFYEISLNEAFIIIVNQLLCLKPKTPTLLCLLQCSQVC